MGVRRSFSADRSPQIHLTFRRPSINVGLPQPHLLLKMAAEPHLCFTVSASSRSPNPVYA